ncbi:Hsp33 family molecular chaperone [Chthonobacter rhizosphaerae]|uniref:Hsp33 family molecular chaperone n=1 Tax=Chthonobacter rhizosphaerae TaxID=2735553 RepID=UPI0015EE56A2|nr:Hsp33 family molecular chaperone [Chthonobacter rhizosphaerae]
MSDFQSAGRPVSGDDSVLPFQVDALDARGRVVHLGPALDTIISRHDYPPAVSRLLGEAVALTALLGTSLKFEGRFIVQTQSDGPVHMLVVDFETPDRLRACARFDRDAVMAAVAAGMDKPEDLLGNGHLAMTVDQGQYTNRYQGVVPLDGRSLEDAAHQYFAQSEQIPTRVRLAVGELMTRDPGHEPRREWRAGGLLVQFLPESEDRVRVRDLHPGDAPEGTDPYVDEHEDDDAWTEARVLVETVEDVELTDPAVSAESLLFRLFHERGVRVFDRQPLKEQCRCSRERIDDMLRTFTPDERRDMTVDDRITVTCEFCSTVYDFDPVQFDAPADGSEAGGDGVPDERGEEASPDRIGSSDGSADPGSSDDEPIVR